MVQSNVKSLVIHCVMSEYTNTFGVPEVSRVVAENNKTKRKIPPHCVDKLRKSDWKL